MNINICGLTASGKTYQSKLLAENLGYKHLCSSDLLLKFLEQEGGLIEDKRNHFWINSENVTLIEKYRSGKCIDKEIDKYVTQLCSSSDNVVIESRTLSWMYHGSNLLRIYLNPSLQKRAEIAYNSRERKEFTLEEIKEEINKKDQRDIQRFKELYDIYITDLRDFDLVIDNGYLSPKETQRLLLDFVRNSI